MLFGFHSVDHSLEVRPVCSVVCSLWYENGCAYDETIGDECVIRVAFSSLVAGPFLHQAKEVATGKRSAWDGDGAAIAWEVG